MAATLNRTVMQRLAAFYGRWWCKRHPGTILTHTYAVAYKAQGPLVAITATDDEHRIVKVFWQR